MSISETTKNNVNKARSDAHNAKPESAMQKHQKRCNGNGITKVKPKTKKKSS